MTLTEIASAARDMSIAQQSQHRTAIALHEQAIKHHEDDFWQHSNGNAQQANIAYSQAQTIQKDPW